MKSLATDIRTLISLRLASAPASEILEIASALCANEPQIAPVRSSVVSADRFTRLDKVGKGTLADDWCAVYDASTDLTWTRNDLGAHAWAAGKKVCSDCRLLGATDWRSPTPKELVSILDYGRHSPAVDTRFFSGEFGYTWTDTPDAESPSGCAWSVYLRDGGVFRYGRSVQCRVRAVRAGQLGA